MNVHRGIQLDIGGVLDHMSKKKLAGRHRKTPQR
jgi:hypothetical protein